MKFCSLCNSSLLRTFFEADRVPMAPNAPLDPFQPKQSIYGKLNIVLCQECGHVHNMKFDPAHIPLIYSEGYSSSLPTDPTILKSYLDLLDQEIGKAFIQDKQVLEIGAGDMTFSRLLAESASHVYAVEPSDVFDDPKLVSPKITRIKDYFPSSKLVSLKFDVIFARHVIEHVEDPIEFIQHLVALTDLGSLIYVEVPNVEDILAKLRYYDFFYEHVHYFNPETLTQLFNCFGFTAKKVVLLRQGQHFGLFLERTSLNYLPLEESIRNLPIVKNLFEQVINFEHQRDTYFSKLENFFAQCRENKRKVAIWGAGCHGITLASHLNLDTTVIDCFIDMNLSKRGKIADLSYVPIRHPDDVDFVSLDDVVIVASLHQSSILNQLKKLVLAHTKLWGTYPTFQQLN